MGNDRRRRWIRPILLGLGAGLAAGVALPPQGWPWLLWPALAVLWSLAAEPLRPRAFHVIPAFAWGMAAVLVSHLWLLWLHPLDWIGVPPSLSLPLCLGVWLLCGTVGGGLVGLWAVAVGRLDPRHPATALIGATGWGLAEIVLAKGPLFWIGLGAAALPGDPPLAGLASLGGAGVLAAIQLLLGWGLWRIVAVPRARPLRLALLAGLLLALQLAGAAALAPAARDDGGVEKVVVLQPAIPTRRKFLASEQRRLLQRLREALQQAADLDAAALLLPEGALPLGQPLPETAASVEVLSGGFRWTGAEQRSSILRFPPGERFPRQWVDKHRVVPLGEWVPLPGLLRWSGLSAVGGLEPGPPSRLLRRPSGPIGVAICYEISDGASLAAAVRQGAGWLLATANLDPYPAQLKGQFTALARLRAIEAGRWLVSAANTGPSLLVDARGRVLRDLPAGIPATGAMRVQRRSRLTPYARWGEAPLLLLLIGACGGRWRIRARGKVETSPTPSSEAPCPGGWT